MNRFFFISLSCSFNSTYFYYSPFNDKIELWLQFFIRLLICFEDCITIGHANLKISQNFYQYTNSYYLLNIKYIFLFHIFQMYLSLFDMTTSVIENPVGCRNGFHWFYFFFVPSLPFFIVNIMCVIKQVYVFILFFTLYFFLM